MTNSGENASSADREIVTTRLFNAPCERVYKAWTDPEQVVQWWGPNGFTNTNLEMDVQPGGIWRFVMHGPDGSDYPNKIVFVEVTPPSRLVYDHSDDVTMPEVSFRSTVTFDNEAGKTRVIMRAVFGTREQRDQVAREFGAIEGAGQHLNRLGQFLAGTPLS